jgi:hypothetical protein
MVYHYTYICEITYLWIAVIQEIYGVFGGRGKSEIALNDSVPSVGHQRGAGVVISRPKE